LTSAVTQVIPVFASMVKIKKMNNNDNADKYTVSHKNVRVYISQQRWIILTDFLIIFCIVLMANNVECTHILFGTVKNYIFVW